MTGVDRSTTYVRRPGLDAVDMDGELVMMGLEQGEYYALKGSAVSLWAHLAEPRTSDELVRLVVGEYDVDPATCAADVGAFLSDAVDRRLVDVSGGPTPGR